MKCHITNPHFAHRFIKARRLYQCEGVPAFSPEARAIVADRLGSLCDLLHAEARLGRDLYGLTGDHHREAADLVAELKEGLL